NTRVVCRAQKYTYHDSDYEHTEQWVDPDRHREAAAALAAWAAAYAPRKPSEDEILAALEARIDPRLSADVGGRAMVFAEDGVEVIFNELLGIGSIHAE